MASEVPEDLALTELVVDVKDSEEKLRECVTQKNYQELVRVLNEAHPPPDLNRVYDCIDGAATIMNLAARSGRVRIAELLLEKGASVDPPSDSQVKQTPLEDAIEYGYLKMAVLLVNHGAEVSQDTLFNVIRKGYTEVARAIIMYVDKDKVPKSFKNKTFPLSKKDRKKLNMMYKFHHLRQTKKNTIKLSRFYRHEDNTPFRELIRKMPEVACEVLDECLIERAYADNQQNEHYSIGYDYQFINDFYETVHTVHQGEASTINTWGPERFTKSNHPLSIMVRHKREKMLQHPVVSSLIHFKWKRYGVLSYAINIIIYFIHLLFLTTFALTLPNPQDPNLECLGLAATNRTNVTCPLETSTSVYLHISAVTVFVLSVGRLILEIIQMSKQRLEYFADWVNVMEIILYPCSIIFVSIFTNWFCPCVFNWQWQVGVVAVFLAWIDFIVFTAKFPYVGIYVLMFLEVIKTFLKLTFIFLLFIVTFAIVFYMVFNDPLASRSPFALDVRLLLQTLVMFRAQLTYHSIFRLSPSDTMNNLPELPFLPVACILWVVFIIIMPLLFANLLTGLAFQDSKKVKREAEFRLTSLLVDQVLTIEELFPSKVRRRINKNGLVLFPSQRLDGWWKKFVHGLSYFGWPYRYDRLEIINTIIKPEQAEEEKVEEILTECKKIEEKMETFVNKSEFEYSISELKTIVSRQQESLEEKTAELTEAIFKLHERKLAALVEEFKHTLQESLDKQRQELTAKKDSV